MIHRLFYRSDMNIAGTASSVDQQIAEIVRRAEVRNAACDITGVLLHTRGVILQVLEGSLPGIESTFERICCDRRHCRVELIELGQAGSRLFTEWSLGCISADQKIERLIGAPATDEQPDLNAQSAQATIQLMRSLLVAGTANGNGLQLARRNATAVQ